MALKDLKSPPPIPKFLESADRQLPWVITWDDDWNSLVRYISLWADIKSAEAVK